MTTTTTPALTARLEGTEKKPVVVLYADGVEIARAGGARAARAEAVVVTKWATEDAPGIYGVRGDLGKAEVEAARLTERRPMMVKARGRMVQLEGKNGPIFTNAAEWAEAVPVERPAA